MGSAGDHPWCSVESESWGKGGDRMYREGATRMLLGGVLIFLKELENRRECDSLAEYRSLN
jgi:hypothetical protein